MRLMDTIGDDGSKNQNVEIPNDVQVLLILASARTSLDNDATSLLAESAKANNPLAPSGPATLSPTGDNLSLFSPLGGKPHEFVHRESPSSPRRGNVSPTRAGSEASLSPRPPAGSPTKLTTQDMNNDVPPAFPANVETRIKRRCAKEPGRVWLRSSHDESCNQGQMYIADDIWHAESGSDSLNDLLWGFVYTWFNAELHISFTCEPRP